MSRNQTSSRDRMLAALSGERPDHVPCSFMIFTALQQRCTSQTEFVERQRELGLDARVELPDLPIRFAPDVAVRVWTERPEGAEHPLLHKEYRTPSGTLTAVVRQTGDWPYGDQVPLFDDYLTPRSEKFLVTGPADLPALRHLLVPPVDEDIRQFRELSAKRKRFALDRGLLFCGGWTAEERADTAKVGADAGTMGIDALMWMCGAVNPLIWAYDQPDFLEELVDIVAVWNRRRMEIILDAGVDLLFKRAWYEGTDFWSPALYRRFIVPVLQEDIALTHAAGAKFGYMITSGMMPLLDDLMELHTDAIIGVDPVQGKGTDLSLLAQGVGGKMCLWGGVNGFITIERGRPEEIRQAVEEALTILAPRGGFILSPVDNVRDTSAETWQKVLEFIRDWMDMRDRY